MELAELLQPSKSPWYSAYWFSRMLMNLPEASLGEVHSDM